MKVGANANPYKIWFVYEIPSCSGWWKCLLDINLIVNRNLHQWQLKMFSFTSTSVHKLAKLAMKAGQEQIPEVRP